MAEQELEAIDSAEAFAAYVLETPGPGGSPNTNEEWITKGQVMDFWDMAIVVTKQSMEARQISMDEADERALISWWASGAIQGFIVAKSQDQG